MNAKCTLPEEKRAEALRALSGWDLSLDEEEEIGRMFPQYLFFRNDYRDDGWNVSSDPVRICTCTSCGETFEAVRGNYARGKLHHEKCNCPQCGAEIEGIAAGKYKYDMKALERWVKVAIARADEGNLLIVAGNAVRRFNQDCLTGEIEFWPEKKYFFGAEGSCEWKIATEWEGCRIARRDWTPTKTVGDPFQPNIMGYCDYDGSYRVIGLGEALPETTLKYCQIMEFFHRRVFADLDDRNPARAIVKYLAWYCIHPQIEFAVKIGLEGAVEELITEGKKNRDLLDWNARKPEKFLRMSKQEAKAFLAQEMDFTDLIAMKRNVKLSVADYLMISESVGKDNIRELLDCAEAAGVSIKEAAKYVRSLQPRCARYAMEPRVIVRTWKDYLSMAAQLNYDLTERTVAMPKDLNQRHDAAAATIEVESQAEALKRYKKRRRQLEMQYGFQMGGYCILVPTGTTEIVLEGKTLHHCVGGYAERHMQGKTTILFLRKERTPGRSFLTIEMEKRAGKQAIRQIHGYRNEGYGPATKPEERFAWFLGPWLEWVNAGSERDRNGKPILPGAETEEMTMEVNAG